MAGDEKFKMQVHRALVLVLSILLCFSKKIQLDIQSENAIYLFIYLFICLLRI